MRITNEILIECLNSSIIDYNQQFYKEEDKDKKLPVIDEENGEISDENLKKIKNFRVVINISNLTMEEQTNFSNALKELLSKMQLDVFAITVLNSRDRRKPSTFNLSFLDELSERVSNLQIRGIDLSKQNQQLFEKFVNLKILSLEKCNISNPNLINNLEPSTRISLNANIIAPEYYKDMLKLIEKHDGKIEVSDGLLRKISEIFSRKEIQLSTLIQLEGDIDFSTFESFKIVVDKDFDFDSCNVEKIIEFLNKLPNATLVSNIYDFIRLSKKGELTIPVTVFIKSVKELSANDIEGYANISSVRIQDGKNTRMQQGEPYTREEYLLVRREIDKILEDIEISAQDIPNREHKIFAQIYRKLGKKIKYDYHAISKEGRKDERLEITCRNLYGGLVQNKCVCAGYADILRNVLACVDIVAEYVSACVDIDGGVVFDLKDPSGHAWNRVMLDGRQYWTDLTWDRENIVAERYPLTNFLKSTKDFGHKGLKVTNLDMNNDICTESLPEDYQIELLGGEKVQSSEEGEKVANLNYLSSMVVRCAEEGIRASELIGVGNEATELKHTLAQDVEDVQK